MDLHSLPSNKKPGHTISEVAASRLWLFGGICLRKLDGLLHAGRATITPRSHCWNRRDSNPLLLVSDSLEGSQQP